MALPCFWKQVGSDVIPWNRRLSITWEPVKNANYQALSCASCARTSGSELGNLCSNKTSTWFWCPLTSRTSSLDTAGLFGDSCCRHIRLIDIFLFHRAGKSDKKITSSDNKWVRWLFWYLLDLLKAKFLMSFNLEQHIFFSIMFWGYSWHLLYCRIHSLAFK